MLRFVVSQLRGRPRRVLAMLAGILAATTGFIVLSGSATTSQIRTKGAPLGDGADLGPLYQPGAPSYDAARSATCPRRR
ncbi:hypothetical protein [Actinoplanes sp. NPDC089786]|uniref:hypothetical protein n=1 Tax=Actinoplanes sp. NPDC089786 TaxID=3155185 RepID=UPI0034248EC6